jgi:hypothetical protein
MCVVWSCEDTAIELTSSGLSAAVTGGRADPQLHLLMTPALLCTAL